MKEEDLQKLKAEYDRLLNLGYSHAAAKIEVKCLVDLGLMRNNTGMEIDELLTSFGPNEYERLKEKKYTEESFDVSLDGLSTLDLEERSVNPEQPERKDKDVFITDSAGIVTKKRVSSLMLGKNVDKDGNIKIDLSDGSYISESEIREALEREVAKVEEPKIIISKRTGERLNKEQIDMLIEVSKQAGRINLGDPSSKITNQDTMTWSVAGKGMDTLSKRGVMMLGNVGIKLPNGDYVSREELEKALTDYVIMTPPKVIVPPVIPPIIPTGGSTSEPNPTTPVVTDEEDDKEIEPVGETKVPEEETTVKEVPNDEEIEKEEPKEETPVVSGGPTTISEPKPTAVYTEKPTKKVKKRKKGLKILLVALAALSLLSGLRIKDKTETVVITDLVEKTAITQQIELDATYTDEAELQSLIDQTIIDANNTLAVGSEVELKDGDRYYESSDYKYGGASRYGTIGSGIRLEGGYTINKLSVIHEGKIIETSITNEDQLGDVMKGVADELGVSVSNLEGYVHIDGPRCGWMSSEVFQDVEKLTEDVIEKYMVDSTYHVEEDELQSSAVSFTNKDGVDVTIQIRDENGNIIENGTKVPGSDGNEYIINNVEYKEIEQAVTEEVSREEEVTSKHLTWSIKDAIPGLTVGLAASALATYLANKKKAETKEESKTI